MPPQHQALSWGHACKFEEQLQAEANSLLRQAELADQSAIADGMSIPEELEGREKRLEAITKAQREIEHRAEERYAKEKAELCEKADITPPTSQQDVNLITRHLLTYSQRTRANRCRC